MWKCYTGGKLECPQYPRNDMFGAIKVIGNTREKWNRNAMNIRWRHLREPDIADDEATLANDPLFSKEALSGYVDKKEAPNRRKQLKTYLTAAEEKTEEIVNFC